MMRRFLSSLLLAMICLTAMPLPAGAFNPFPDNSVCNNAKAQQSAACKATGADPISGSGADCDLGKPLPTDGCGILIKITRIVAYFAGAIAVIMIIVGAIRFATSGSDVSTGSRTDTDVEEARRTVASALVGLAVIILAQAIITYVIRRL